MIEGLKVTVRGDELARLCSEQAAFHAMRVSVYEKQIDNMKASRIEGQQNYTNGDPIQSLEQRRLSHDNQSRELTFIAKHLQEGEVYLLDRTALQQLGIVRGGLFG